MKFIQKILLFLLLILIPSIISLLYIYELQDYMVSTYSLGMITGITGFIFLVISLILATRIRYIDRLFGHDKVMIFHGYLALTGIIFIIIHYFIKDSESPVFSIQLMSGQTALIGYGVIMITTLLIMVPNVLHKLKIINDFRLFINKKLKLDYDILKIFHNLTFLITIIAGVHIILANSTRYYPLRLSVITSLLIITIIFYIYMKFIRYFINKSKQFRITSVSKMSSSIVEITMASKKNRILKHESGQFAFFKFIIDKRANSEHPFTISSCPNHELIKITVKNLGNFTKKLQYINIGEMVIIDGPYGTFSQKNNKNNQIFIAGGIGITPFVSMIREAEKKGFSVKTTLYWGGVKKSDLIYDDYFRKTAESLNNFNYHPYISEENPNWKGRTGHINILDIIEDEGDITKNTYFYLCGPPGMKKALKKQLKQHKVKNKNIFKEDFTL